MRYEVFWHSIDPCLSCNQKFSNGRDVNTESDDYGPKPADLHRFGEEKFDA